MANLNSTNSPKMYWALGSLLSYHSTPQNENQVCDHGLKRFRVNVNVRHVARTHICGL